jgi:hypothetical protein
MDHNRRGLALMLSAMLLSILVASLRSCEESGSHKLSRLDMAGQALMADAYSITAPVTDYRIRSIQNGVMVVEAGPSLDPQNLRALAGKLLDALHDREHEPLGSDMVFVTIERSGRILCEAQTSARGPWIKLR